MPTIDDILNGLDPEGSEKTASQNNSSESEIEKQAKELGLINKNEGAVKTASENNGGTDMYSLEDLYAQEFGGADDVVKTASAGNANQEDNQDYDFDKEASAEYQAGVMAGESFNDELFSHLGAFAVKLAMDGEKGHPDSAATKDSQKGPGVIPGAKTQDPQLPTQKDRHSESDDTNIDTDPQYYDLKGMDGAVNQARLKKMLESNNVEGVSHSNKNVDTGLEQPTSQKTASIRMRDLTKAQLDLLQTQFPEDMVKSAEAQVEEEFEKRAELQEQANQYYDHGSELAMQKIAEMEEEYKKSKSKEEDEDEDEDEEEKKDAEKTASAAGKFIFQGYWNTMMEKAAEYYGEDNATVYLEELIKEAKLDKMMAMLGKGKNSAIRSGKKAGKKAAKHMKKNKGAYGAGAGAGAAGGLAGYAAGRSGKD